MSKKISILLSFVFFSIININAHDESISLNGRWTLQYWEQPTVAVRSPEGMKNADVKQVSANVPGNVELDLLNAGIIKDPSVGNNIYDLRPYEGYEWCYSRHFNAPSLKENQRLQLWFGGIDCLADVYVNGKLVGSPENMMTEHSYDITDVTNKSGDNLLQVIIRSSVLEGQRHLLGTFSVGTFPSGESIYARKAPHSFGWDIMPRLVSAGLWRNVELRVLNPVRFRDVNYLVSSLDTASRNVQLFVDIQLSMPMKDFDHVKARVSLSRNGKIAYSSETPVVSPSFRCVMGLQQADLWWPRGYGEPSLYDAKAELIDENGNVVDTDERQVGLRTVRLDLNSVNLPGNPGRFCFYVNGEPIFIHGTNWVPLDGFHSRDTMHVDKMMAMASDLNINMIRCWGGNVYEDTHFFDLCDRLGILVWQDFAMGCSFYPQRDDFAKSIEQEVQSLVVKLRNHPSIALWSGNNEDDAVYRWTLSSFNFDPNRDRISRHVIPQVLYEFDLTRPYLPSSPYFSEEAYQRGGDDTLLPENHLWGPRGYYKAPYYTGATCKFVSEIGYHGCPNVESLKKMFTKDSVYPWTDGFQWNEEWLTKSVRRFAVLGKTNARNDLMLNQIRLLFGDVPTKLEDFVFASQSVQAEAMKYFLERWRGKKFDDKTGIIWWNLRDGWPLISDAIVDYYYSKKRAYYYLRNAERDVCVFINDEESGTYPLMAVNDTRNEVKGSVAVTDVESGKTVYKGSFTVPRNGKTRIAGLPVNAGKGIYLIKYNVGGKEFVNHYLYGNPPFSLAKYKELIEKAKII
jgi:beta-mannosidase